MGQSVPDRIERELRGTLVNLRALHNIIAQTREALDERMGGCGRYEADAYLNTGGKISAGLAYVAEFRSIASTRGIDAEAVIADLGGVPEFRISPAALEWVECSQPANGLALIQLIVLTNLTA